ncbi:MAG: SDR family oxidoreductase [Flavobacteriales bacterium]
MHILLTGATGYIGKRLLPILLEQGHTVTCAVRDPDRLPIAPELANRVKVMALDLLGESSDDALPKDIEAAYYLVHSLGDSSGFNALEARTAERFRSLVENTSAKQVIYLGGIVNEGDLSPHLASRKQVETLLLSDRYGLTVLRAGIIVGSGSASFEIIRDLVEKLPVMITPKWLHTKCQPIGIRDVLECLTGVLGRPETYNETFDIGGPEILTYKEMLLGYAAERGLKRWIGIVPVMTPRLSSYWLFFVTSVPYRLATHLVDSMKTEVVCNDQRLQMLIGQQPMPYRKAIRLAFDRIEQDLVTSSWKDAFIHGRLAPSLRSFVSVPRHGCYTDHRRFEVSDPEAAVAKIWAIGGRTGWYYGTWLWALRGWMDRLSGGVGLRRGRTHPTQLRPGDALDFWRVLIADRTGKHLLLYAEMKLPGEAWLEFRIVGDGVLHQTATFRPRGLFGRLYWWMVTPFHAFVFRGMAKRIAQR